MRPTEGDLERFKSHAQQVAELRQWIMSQSKERGHLEILEAGCGRRWPIALDDVPHRLTGIDLDRAALEIRRDQVGDLHEVIVGDLADRSLCKESRFDIIYSAFVLEHVQGALAVLENMAHWLKPEGLLILRIPDRDSAYGFLARTTPFWFHVAVKRYVEGQRNAGKPGFDPYPTVHEEVISRSGIRRFAEESGCEVLREVGQSQYLPRHPVIGPLVGLTMRLVSAVSLGRLDWRHNNLFFVLRKR